MRCSEGKISQCILPFKSSLHTTKFSKYTELLQLTNFLADFEIIFEMF